MDFQIEKLTTLNVSQFFLKNDRMNNELFVAQLPSINHVVFSCSPTLLMFTYIECTNKSNDRLCAAVCSKQEAVVCSARRTDSLQGRTKLAKARYVLRDDPTT